jgi:NDP-sugar pyrophosphorylase family protein
MLPDVTLKCIVSKDSTSVGDALREMYSLNVLQEDFVLVWGDIVSNMKLTKLIDEHTKRREKDKQSLMTVLLTPYREPRTLRDGSGSAVALPGAAVTVKAAAPGTTAITPSEARRAPAKPAAAMSAPKPKSKPADTQPKSTKQSKSLAFDASSSDDETSKDKDEDYGSGFDDSDEDNYGFDGSDGSDDDGDDDDDYDDEVGGESRSARKEADSRRTVAFDGTTNQLLLYTESSGRESLLELDMEVFQTHPKLTFRDDLEDAGVAVCSTEVLFQFQDNFDYETVPQFVKGVVNEEILACKVFAHLDNSGQYIGRVASLRRYQQVSWDILQRWAYPFVPDMNMGMVDTNFTYSRGTLGGAGFYTEKRVHLARSAKIGSDTFHHIESMIGERTQVGANSRISSSIIGRGCRIGANVTIIGSFIWDDAIIGDNVTIMSSMICSNAEIGAGSRLSEGGGGVIVANNVRIPPGISVPALTKVTVTTKRLDASDDDFGGDDDDDDDDDDDNDDQDEDKPTKAVPVPVEWATWAINPSTGQPATPSIEINTTVKVFVWHQPTVPFCELITGWEPQLKASLEVEAAKKPTKGQSSMSSDDESGDESFGFNEDFKFDENDKAAAARAAASIAASGAKKTAASPPTTQSPTTTAKKASLLAASSHANPVSAAPATVKSALSAPLRSSGTLKKAASVKPKPKDDFDGDDDDDDIGDVSDIQKFRQEVVKTVGRAVAENHKVDTLTLEINSLKFAYDTNFLDCAASIFDGLMSRVDTAAPVKSIKTVRYLLAFPAPAEV